ARRGSGRPEPHAALVDAVVPARARHLPPRAALSGPAALATGVGARRLDRGRVPRQRQQHVLALAHPRSALLLHAGLVVARARRGPPLPADRLPPGVVAGLRGRAARRLGVRLLALAADVGCRGPAVL